VHFSAVTAARQATIDFHHGLIGHKHKKIHDLTDAATGAHKQNARRMVSGFEMSS
jgi:hypothetical protein